MSSSNENTNKIQIHKLIRPKMEISCNNIVQHCYVLWMTFMAPLINHKHFNMHRLVWIWYFFQILHSFYSFTLRTSVPVALSDQPTACVCSACHKNRFISLQDHGIFLISSQASSASDMELLSERRWWLWIYVLFYIFNGNLIVKYDDFNWIIPYGRS